MKTFNTQVCTTKEQSKRLLELGLKKETADMVYCVELYENGWKYSSTAYVLEGNLGVDEIHAWSLHRIIAMLPKFYKHDYYLEIFDNEVHYRLIGTTEYGISHYSFCKKKNLYGNIIDCIEWLIKNKHFNKEYLEE